MSSNLHGNFALLSWWSTVLLITLGKCSAINSFTYERDVTSATSEPLVQLAINGKCLQIGKLLVGGNLKVACKA